MLLDLPPEFLCDIFQLGELGIAEAQAIRACSRGLYLATELLGFWLVVAQTIDVSVHPLPIPPFRTLGSLGLQELKKVCLNAQHIHDNLLRPDPSLRQDVWLNTSELGKGVRSGIYHFAFLPGGRHVLIMTVGGEVTCWDIEREVLRKSGGDDNGADDDSKAKKVVGRVLASHDSLLRPLMWNFCADGESVLVAVYGAVAGGQQELQVIHLILPKDPLADTADMQVLFTIHVLLPYGGIDISSDYILIHGTASMFNSAVLMLVVDVHLKRCCFIDTCVEESASTLNYDAFLVPDGSIILFSEDDADATVHMYNDVKTLLDEHSVPVEAFQWNARPHAVPADASRKLPFHESCQVTNRIRWYTVHPWNTSNSLTKGLIPIFTTSSYEQEDGLPESTRRTVTHMWLDPLALSAHMRQDELSTEPLVLQRAMFDINLPIMNSLDGQELIVPGYCGTHFVWISPSDNDEEGEGGGKMWMKTLPLPTAPESMDRVKDPVVLPTEARLTPVDALDLCEEMGLIALAPRVDLDQPGERYVRLLYY